MALLQVGSNPLNLVKIFLKSLIFPFIFLLKIAEDDLYQASFPATFQFYSQAIQKNPQIACHHFSQIVSVIF